MTDRDLHDLSRIIIRSLDREFAREKNQGRRAAIAIDRRQLEGIARRLKGEAGEQPEPEGEKAA